MERIEPSGSNTVLRARYEDVLLHGRMEIHDMLVHDFQRRLSLLPLPQKGNPTLTEANHYPGESNIVIRNVEDFQIRGDYMFATSKSSKVRIKY